MTGIITAAAGLLTYRPGETNILRESGLRTEITPISQTAGNDYALPEVTRHVAHFTDYEAEEQTEESVNEGD